MTTQPFRARLGKLGAIALILCLIPACKQPGGARPYVSARPTFTPSGGEIPLRLGGYAGANYGRGRRAIVVTPVAPIEGEPSLDPGSSAAPSVELAPGPDPLDPLEPVL